MQAIEAHPRLRLELLVTDMHLQKQFGNTVTEVGKWFKKHHRIHLRQQGDTSEARAVALGRAVIGMTQTLSTVRPDILVTLGDRGEVLAAATAALELNIPVAHILGGDRAGNRDGVRIHAITKLSHLHFPANADAYRRILDLGEEKHRVYNFGSTYIDLILQGKHTSNAIARERYGLAPDEKYILCIQHPTTLNEGNSYAEAKLVYEALAKLPYTKIVVWPCSDQGYRDVLRALNEFRDDPLFMVYRNIEAVDYWGLMEGAACIVGNSSSGLMESPYFRLPSVTVGDRQADRARDTNVIEVRTPTPGSLRAALERALSPKFRAQFKNRFVFGRGNAGARIAEVLADIPLENLHFKKINF